MNLSYFKKYPNKGYLLEVIVEFPDGDDGQVNVIDAIPHSLNYKPTGKIIYEKEKLPKTPKPPPIRLVREDQCIIDEWEKFKNIFRKHKKIKKKILVTENGFGYSEIQWINKK